MNALLRALDPRRRFRPKPTADIGVLLVHGIGDQGRFDFLDEVVRSLAIALTYCGEEEEKEPPQVSVSLRGAGGSLVGAATPTLSEDGGAAAEIVVRRRGRDPVRLAIHEAWWGDVIDPPTLFRPIKFFCWGLALWAVPFKTRNEKPDPGTLRQEPAFPAGRSVFGKPWVRVQLFFVGYLVISIGLVASLGAAVLRLVTRQNVPDVLLLAISYMSDIKLYTQATPRRAIQTVPLDWVGQHSRFAIRARAIRGLVDMALRRYPQWWVMGHSMGSVVAYSALSTPDALLPRYLDEDRWAALKADGYGAHDEEWKIGTTAVAQPAWLPDDAGVNRGKLLKNLRGLITYGSPLDKFAQMWPATVSMARDKAPLAGKRWINVHDVTDPVAGELDAYGKRNRDDMFAPLNVHYPSSRMPLWSHLRYLATPAAEPRASFAAQLVRWWLDEHDHVGGPLTAGPEPDWRTFPSASCARRTLSKAFWLVVGILAPLLSAALAAWLIGDNADAWLKGRPWLLDLLGIEGRASALGWWSRTWRLAIGLAALAVLVVLLAGAFVRSAATSDDDIAPMPPGAGGGGSGQDAHVEKPATTQGRYT